MMAVGGLLVLPMSLSARALLPARPFERRMANTLGRVTWNFLCTELADVWTSCAHFCVEYNGNI